MHLMLQSSSGCKEGNTLSTQLISFLWLLKHFQNLKTWCFTCHLCYWRHCGYVRGGHMQPLCGDTHKAGTPSPHFYSVLPFSLVIWPQGETGGEDKWIYTTAPQGRAEDCKTFVPVYYKNCTATIEFLYLPASMTQIIVFFLWSSISSAFRFTIVVMVEERVLLLPNFFAFTPVFIWVLYQQGCVHSNPQKITASSKEGYFYLI